MDKGTHGPGTPGVPFRSDDRGEGHGEQRWFPEVIFWDLDGTLAWWRSLRVVAHIAWAYLGRLRQEVPLLTGALATARAYRRMLHNQGPRTNDELFNRLMAASLDRTPAAMADLTRQLLARPEVGAAVDGFLCPIPEAHALVRAAAASGRFRQVVATSPVMPSAFNRERLARVGYDPGWFVHVTGSEFYTSQKDDPRFYRELLTQAGALPDRCLMVGNDLGKDLVAKTAGIPMFLLRTPHTRLRPPPPGLTPDWEGSYDRLADLLALAPLPSAQPAPRKEFP